MSVLHEPPPERRLAVVTLIALDDADKRHVAKRHIVHPERTPERSLCGLLAIEKLRAGEAAYVWPPRPGDKVTCDQCRRRVSAYAFAQSDAL